MSESRDLISPPTDFASCGASLNAKTAGTAEGRAALVQSRAMVAVRARLRERGTTRAHVARACGFSDRHLRRIITGEHWARLTNLTALAEALELDLLLLPGPEGEDGKRSVVRLSELG